MTSQPDLPRCSVFIAVSLDGYIARSDGGVDWLECVQIEGEDYGFQEFFNSIDALVFGRNTYDTALGFSSWPYSGKRSIVLTHRPTTSRHGEEYYSGSPLDLVELLRKEGIRRIYIDGGDVIRQFLNAKVIDDMTISIVPIILGSGIPLFTSGLPEQRLVLEASRSWPSGLTQPKYRFCQGAGVADPDVKN